MRFINSIVYVQQQLDNKFRNFQEFCRVYIDNIIIISITLKEHLKHLDKIFSKLTELHINLAFSKFYIGFFKIMLLEQHIDSLDISNSVIILKEHSCIIVLYIYLSI